MVSKLLSVAACASLAVISVGSSLTYAFRPSPIRSAVVLVDSQQFAGTQANYAPYVLFNLDSNRGMKPGGWTFYNPNAPTRVTAEIKARWDAINAGQASPASAAIGEPIGKRNAAYWELRLSTASEAQLSQYDFLVLPARGFISLNPLEREKLRRFMEGGGVLWVDFATPLFGAPGLSYDAANGFPLGFGLTNTNGALTPGNDFTHPLLCRPNQVTLTDVYQMDSENVFSMRDLSLADMGYGSANWENFYQTTLYEFARFSVVSQDGRGRKIATGQVGDGWLVVTTRGIATTINRVIPPGGSAIANTVSESVKPSFDRTSDSASRLAFNMVYLTSNSAQAAKGSRKTGSSSIDVGAPMLKRFSENRNFTPNTLGKVITPVAFKGLTVVTSQSQVFVYDSNPANDLNGDGDPDDGVLDYGVGSDRDLVWSSDILSGPISGPTAAEVPDSGAQNQIAVVDSNGALLIFEAFPAAPSATMTPIATVNPPTAIDPDFAGLVNGPYSPTFHDGLYFITDQITVGINSVGRIWAADASNGTLLNGASAPFALGTTTTPVFGRPSGSSTVGYIPIADGSGGLDRVAYVPTRPNATGGPNSTAGFHSLWLGARGEKPAGFADVAGGLVVIPRCQLQGLQVFQAGGESPLGIKLTIIDSAGNPLTPAQMNTIFTGDVLFQAGQIRFDYRPAQTLPAGASVRLDYTIDWGFNTPGYGLQALRGNVFLPDDTLRRRNILGTLALSPEGVLHLVHSDPNASSNNTGGSYYAFREDLRGQFKMVARYELYREHNIALNQAGTQAYREVFADNDPITTLPGPAAALSGRFSTFRYVSGPSIHNGVVYVMAQGTKTGVPQAFIPFQIMLAFDATPPTPEIVVGDLGSGMSVLQPDIARSDNKATPTVQSILSQGNFVYEKPSGAVNGVIRFENLMQNTRGPVGNSMSLSQPIILRLPGRPDVLIEPNRVASRWSPLKYYMVIHSFQGNTPPVGTGATVFWMGRSVIPWAVETGFSFATPPRFDPIVYGIDADISPNSTYLVTDSTRPWQKQLISFKINPTFSGNPSIRWPQNEGTTDFNDWAVRLLQTKVPNSTQEVGLAAGDDSLVAVGNGAVSTFRKADFIICDEARIARFDASGNPVWMTDASTGTGISGDFGLASFSRPLVRPTKAYVLNAREMFVVDTGSNRVIRLDQSGRETRSIEGFRLDPLLTPEGYEQTESSQLKEPRDVIVFSTYEFNPTFVSNPQPKELWMHYIIADSGNNRIVEIVDRYRVNAITNQLEAVVVDATGSPALGILLWQTPAKWSGKGFDYSSLSRVLFQDALNPANTRYVYAAGIGSAMPTRADLGLDQPTTTTPRESRGGNGGVVIFDGPTSTVINEVTIPAIAADIYWDFPSGTWLSAAQPTRVKKLGNLSSVSMRNIIDPFTAQSRLAVMITDAEGVYEVYQPTATFGNIDPNQPWVVRWMMNKEAYRAMRRTVVPDAPTVNNARDFRPTYARRLDSGEVLIVNGWLGKKFDGSAFEGEVIQVNGDIDPTNTATVEGFWYAKRNLGFKSISVKAELPPVQGARGLVLPIFADRR